MTTYSIGNGTLLDARADTTPHGFIGTPFGVVSDALRVVAASAWDVDPSVYRAGIAWAWYLASCPSSLAVDGFRALLCAALVSECAPLVRESQTVGELLALLTLWMGYRPIFADMEALFATYSVRVDVRAISDPEGQLLMPVDDTRLAFYIFVFSMDWHRPMLLGEIAETARRASPLGARPFVLLYVEGSASVLVAPAPTDGFLWVDVWESAVQPIPPAPTLPTVSVTGDYNIGEYGINISPFSGFSTPFSYDQTKVYSISTGDGRGNVSYSGFVCSNQNGLVYATNNTSASIRVFGYTVYECLSNQATVVPVYNSSNVAYNAFKFTASGTDYYYVLDDTQTDWTDDLASIGYDLYLIGYTSSNGTSSQQITASSGKWIYDSSGNKVSVSRTATATVEKYYESVSDTTGSTGGLKLENRYGNLLLLLDGGSSSIAVQRIEYTVP